MVGELEQMPMLVIAGLVPVISIASSAALFLIEMAGTDPRIKSGDGHDAGGSHPRFSAFQ